MFIIQIYFLIRAGNLQTTEGNVIHYGFIEKFIEELGTKYHILEIAFDRWGATQMVQDLEGMGFTVVHFGQGYKDIPTNPKEGWILRIQKFREGIDLWFLYALFC